MKIKYLPLILFFCCFFMFCTHKNKEKVKNKENEIKYNNITLSEFCNEISSEDSIHITFVGNFEKTKVKIVLDTVIFLDETITVVAWPSGSKHLDKKMPKNINTFLLLIDNDRYEIKSLVNWRKYGNIRIHKKRDGISINFCCCDGTGDN